jgi:hypothetical protein
VIVVCIDGEERFRWLTVTSLREVKRIARFLERQVHAGHCDRFVILYDGSYAVEREEVSAMAVQHCIDWEDIDNWGGHVHYASNGSWVADADKEE